MRYLLFFSLVGFLLSCNENPKIIEFEPSLILKTEKFKPASKNEKNPKASTPAILMRSTYLMEKPAPWSAENKPILRAKLPIGTSVLIQDTTIFNKKTYLKLKYGKYLGWSSNWRIIPHSAYFLTLEDITLFKKADITSFTDDKLEAGQYICVDSAEVGDFIKVCFLENDKTLKTCWIESDEIQNISSDTVDFSLYNIYQQLQDSSADKISLLTEIELLKPSNYSKIYPKIKKEYGTLDSLDTYLDQMYGDSSRSVETEDSNLNY